MHVRHVFFVLENNDEGIATNKYLMVKKGKLNACNQKPYYCDRKVIVGELWMPLSNIIRDLLDG